jgi:PKHD-type hydroxylase
VSFINHASENDWIFNRLFVLTDLVNHNFYNLDLIGFDHLQYTLYDTEGSHYGYHMDMQENKSGSEVPRKLSFSLILNDQDEYQGGDLEFFMDDTEQIRAEQRKGRVIAFPSWMVHRVTPVTQGVRRSLVWWACGPKFR